MTKDEKSLLLSRMMEEATKFLRDQPVMTIDDFEMELTEKFLAESKELQEPLKNTGRSEWHNLIDWVKAHLTMRGATFYFANSKTRYLAYLPPCGAVEGRSIVWMMDTNHLISSLVTTFGGTVSNSLRPLSKRRSK